MNNTRLRKLSGLSSVKALSESIDADPLTEGKLDTPRKGVDDAAKAKYRTSLKNVHKEFDKIYADLGQMAELLNTARDFTTQADLKMIMDDEANLNKAIDLLEKIKTINSAHK